MFKRLQGVPPSQYFAGAYSLSPLAGEGRGEGLVGLAHSGKK